MSDLIDIFVKLQIALITLLVPMLIFYINHAFNAKKFKEQEYQAELKKIQEDSQLDAGGTEDFAKQVTTLHKKIAGLTSKKKGDLKLLDPIRQMKRIYGTLLSSFVLIIIDVAVRNRILPYNHILSVVLIVLSVGLFVLASCIVVKVAMVAIKSKEDTENL